MTDRGLMGGNAAAFRPDAPLTQRALADLVAELTELPPPEPAAPAAQATLAGLDQALVRGLGLSDDAPVLPRSPRDRRQASGALRQRGRRAPDRPAQEPRSPLRRARASPDDVANRAEAAYSAAQILRFSGRELEPSRKPLSNRAARLHPVAAPGRPDRLQPDRVPLRLGRDQFRRAVVVRRELARRVRLLGLRLARIQAPQLLGRQGARVDAPRPNGRADGRRGPESSPDRVRGPPARRPPLLRARRPRGEPPSIDPWGSTRVAAG